MTSDDTPPMPAGPPPSAPEPSAPVPVPPAPEPTSGPIVDHVPGSPPPPAGLILPSDLPTWAPLPAEPDPPADAGDTIPVSSFLNYSPTTGTDDSPAPEPAGPPTIPGYSEEWATETQQAWPPPAPPETFAPPEPALPGSFVPPESAPPASFAPPGFVPPPSYAPSVDAPTAFGGAPGGGASAGPVPTGPVPTGPVPAGPVPAGPGIGGPPAGGAHAGGGAGGTGKLIALIVGVVVLIALLGGGGYALFHSSSKKTSAALPVPSAALTPTAAAPDASAAGATPSSAPTSAAASPTVDANLGGMQAKVLQSTVVAPLKNLITDDLHVANATDACVGLAANAREFDAHVAVRQNLLAQLRKLDVTAMENYKTWKGLLEQVELKNIAFEQQLSAYAKDLEKSCDPSTSTQDTHYKQAISIAKVSGDLQSKFLASYNPVAKRYNIPMQSRGNL